ncbi:hypothetical protein ACFV0T_26260 [Streptomyces sp. NPDC059582]|uniref:hypothetical protein n=1 Tax=Streptomyces sp. NPDC059582 TaxID=3346875 RepID=UPI00369F8461
MMGGHSHGPTGGRLVSDCPLCRPLIDARNRAILHLTEALHLLNGTQDVDSQPTIRLNLAPIGLTGDETGLCHSIDITSKLAESLSDAIDSMNAYLGSEQPSSEQPEWSAAAVALKHPLLYADIVDAFDDVDPQSYLDDIVNSDCPEAAQAAFEQMVTGEWDGEL